MLWIPVINMRYLRLRGALCTMELSILLNSCTDLQHIVCSHIDTAIQVEGLCLLLSQNRGKLYILEFQNCRFSEYELLKISGSLKADGEDHCLLQHLFVHSSRTLLTRSSQSSQLMRFLHACSYDRPAMSPTAVGLSSPIDIYSGTHSTSLESYTTEEQQVKCECCGLAEECTPAYIMRIRDMYCGKWVCGLCAEAVKEEHERGQEEGAMSMEEALHAHMSMCMQFNKPEKKGKQVADLAAAMTRLLRKSRDGSSSPRSAPGSPRRGVFISRANSCLSAFSPSERYDDAPL